MVEVKEDQIVRDIKLSQEIARQLKVSGVTVAIDDFGGGYSSFASLRELPFAEFKIDNSFVKDCATEGINGAICQTAIDLAHRFGSVAVAEGIESMADLQALQVMRCDFGQGVLLAPPMPKERFIALLNQRNNKPRSSRTATVKRASPKYCGAIRTRKSWQAEVLCRGRVARLEPKKLRNSHLRGLDFAP